MLFMSHWGQKDGRKHKQMSNGNMHTLYMYKKLENWFIPQDIEAKQFKFFTWFVFFKCW